LVCRAALLGALAALFVVPSALAAPPAQPSVPTTAARIVANARPIDDARVIRAGLAQAVRRKLITRAEADRCRATVRRARGSIAALPAARATPLARVLRVVRLQSGAYTRARVTALCGMLGQNTMYLSRRGLPPSGTDVVGTDGVVYRSGWGYGLQFHPLANVIKLNAYTYAGQRAKVRQLADALTARAVRKGNGAVWEYYFPYGSGSPPWTSGMVQAVGAQALARSSTQLKDTTLAAAAARAYHGLTDGRLVEQLPAGPWVRLYSFSTIAVLNAQLQSALSVADYGRVVANADATALAARLRQSSQALLARFDTGYWSRYALGGAEAPFKYHHFHVELLDFLARRTLEDFWRSAQERFERYSHEAPVFKAPPPRAPIYPWPADGFRDRVRVTFWVSKVSTVSVRVGGETLRLGQEPGGWHTVFWWPGRRAPGKYVPTVTAVDLAGNAGRSRLSAVTIARDRTPPAVKASVSGRRLRWVATDATTPYVTLRVRLTRGSTVKLLKLGRRGLRGTLRLSLPRGRWDAVLLVADSSGNTTRVKLGTVPAPTA
jgi:hypothetical protein